MRAAYEVLNPSFSDMNIEQQIDAGINDWCAEDDAGREFFGRSRDEAEEIRCLHMSHRGAAASVAREAGKALEAAYPFGYRSKDGP